MTERAKLLEAWGHEWAKAREFGIPVEAIPYDASNEGILAAGKALRKRIAEERAAWAAAERIDAAGFARLAGIKKDHAIGILDGSYPLGEILLEELERQRPGCVFRINKEERVMEIRGKP